MQWYIPPLNTYTFLILFQPHCSAFTIVTMFSSLQGPSGPQGPIGYPGPRGVKVWFQFFFDIWLTDSIYSSLVKKVLPFVLLCIIVMYWILHVMLTNLSFLSNRVPMVSVVLRDQRERRYKLLKMLNGFHITSQFSVWVIATEQPKKVMNFNVYVNVITK